MIKRNKKGKKLSREKNQRRALMRSLATNLVDKKRIKTTLAKARSLRPFVEKKVTLAKRCLGKAPEIKVAKIRLLKKDFSQKTIQEIFKLAELFKSREGGYLRIIKITARKSDGAQMAIVEWTEKIEEDKTKEKGKKGKEEKKVDKKKVKAGEKNNRDKKEEIKK